MTNLNLTGYKLTFDDEFNSLKLRQGQSGTWDTNYWWGQPNGSTLTGNAEKEWYIDANYGPTASVKPWSVANGTLDLTAAKADPSIKSAINNYDYTSGMVTSYHSFTQTYGYFEMRAELPAGQGLWPAFWLLPADGSWPPELDVMEMLGSDTTTAFQTVHSQVSGKTNLGSNHYSSNFSAKLPDASKGYHTYGVDWRADKITWYIDGNEVAQADTPSDMHKPFYMLANLAVGGNWPGSPDGSTPFPASMKIDYIRAYSSGSDAVAVAQEKVSAPDNKDPGLYGATTAGGTATPPPTTTPPVTGQPTTPDHKPVSATLGSGSDTLVLKISQDAYNGDAQYTVSVDGRQVGGTLTAGATHASGQSDTIAVKGDWGVGDHKVDVAFLNDSYGGTPATDRNLFVDGATYDGAAVSGSSLSLVSNGAQGFTVHDATPVATTPAPAPTPAPTTTLQAPSSGGRVAGTAANETLLGSGKADDLRGNGGNDKLVGDTGKDILYGGAGNDVFVFGKLADSPRSGALRDYIGDFAQGQDHIDVSAIDANLGHAGNDPFAFIGAKGFSGVAGELRFQAATSGHGGQVQGDVNGDKIADITIDVVTAHPLTAADFLL